MFSSNQPLVANQLPISVDFPKDQNEFLDMITLLYKRIANAVNTKDGAFYLTQEISNFQQYFTPNNPQVLRNVYRKVIDFGQLPNNTSKFVPHGINFTSEFTMTRLYGTATDPVNLLYIPIPFVEVVTPANGSIQLYVDQNNVVIATSSNRSNYTRCYVVLEYVKNQ